MSLSVIHKNKKNKPKDTPFAQQRLSAWQPIWPAPWTVGVLTVAALIFIPVGIAVIVASDSITEITVRYDDIKRERDDLNCSLGNIESESADGLYNNASDNGSDEARFGAPWSCPPLVVRFNVPTPIPAPVFVYYKLENFYQNHRLYSKSIYPLQLADQETDSPAENDECFPFTTPGQYRQKSVQCTDGDIQARSRTAQCPENATGRCASEEESISAVGKLRAPLVQWNVGSKPMHVSQVVYNPCGLQPWSMYNDTIDLVKLPSCPDADADAPTAAEGGDGDGGTEEGGGDGGDGNGNDQQRLNGGLCVPCVSEQCEYTYRSIANVTTDADFICKGDNYKAYGPHKNPEIGPKCHKTGIAWSSDLGGRFNFPSDNKFYPSLDSRGWKEAPDYTKYTPPTTDNSGGESGGEENSSGEGEVWYPSVFSEYVKNGWYIGERGHKIPQAVDLDLIVWLRLAPLSTFKKLYRRIDVDLEAGDYAFIIHERFPVNHFEGTKSVVLATTAWMGQRNYLLGTLYLLMGSLFAVFAIAFAIAYVLYVRPVIFGARRLVTWAGRWM